MYVRGDRAHMLEIVHKQSIFQTRHPTALVRRKQSIDAFERSVIEEQHKNSP